MTALTFAFVVIITAVASYVLGYHVRGEVQEQPRDEPVRPKKSYELKAERLKAHFDSTPEEIKQRVKDASERNKQMRADLLRPIFPEVKSTKELLEEENFKAEQYFGSGVK